MKSQPTLVQPAANATSLAKTSKPIPKELPVQKAIKKEEKQALKDTKTLKSQVEQSKSAESHPKPVFAKKDDKVPKKEDKKVEVAKPTPAPKAKAPSTPTPAPPVKTEATHPGTQDVRIEIMTGSQPITIDVVQEKPAPAAPVAKPPAQAAATTASKADAKEQEKLQKMKEIQDTVKALRKQMDDIDKKDREENMKSSKKDSDEEEDDEPGEQSHAVLIKQRESGLQILTEKDEPKPVAAKGTANSTAQMNSTAQKNATVAAD